MARRVDSAHHPDIAAWHGDFDVTLKDGGRSEADAELPRPRVEPKTGPLTRITHQ